MFIRKFLTVFLCVLLVFIITGCKNSDALTPVNKNWNDYSSLSEKEAEIRKTADSAVMEKFSLDDLSYFDIEYISHTSTVNYTLMFGKYETEESYNVTFKDNGGYEVKDANGGMYSCYLGYVTDEAIEKAEKNLTKQTEEYEQKLIPHFYLSVDTEGYLCLTNEVIIKSENDHQHKFLTERICKKTN